MVTTSGEYRMYQGLSFRLIIAKIEYDRIIVCRSSKKQTRQLFGILSITKLESQLNRPRSKRLGDVHKLSRLSTSICKPPRECSSSLYGYQETGNPSMLFCSHCLVEVGFQQASDRETVEDTQLMHIMFRSSKP